MKRKQAKAIFIVIIVSLHCISFLLIFLSFLLFVGAIMHKVVQCNLEFQCLDKEFKLCLTIVCNICV